MLQTLTRLAERPRVALAVLALAVCAAYGNSLKGEFVFDDQPEIADNPAIRRPGAFWDYTLRGRSLPARPVPYATFYANHWLLGPEPAGYVAVNVAIHVANAWLLYYVVGASLARAGLGWRPGPVRLAAGVTALVWAVHPLQTQSVTYIYQRLESLMALLLLATLAAFIRSTESARPALWRAVSVACCAAGMASKEVMVVAPVVVFWWHWAFVEHNPRRALAGRWAYYACLAATWVVLVMVLQNQKAAYAEFSKPSFASPNSPSYHTPLEHLLTQGPVIARYLRLAFWPAGQNIDYLWPVARGLAEWAPGWALLATLMALTVWALFKSPPASFLGGWFFLILAPTSSVVPVMALAAEHRMYLPLAAVAAGVVVGLGLLGARFGPRVSAAGPRSARLLGGAVAAALAVGLGLGAATWQRNRLYHDPLAMWQDSYAKAPWNFLAAGRYAGELVKADRFAEAIPYLRACLAAEENPVASANLAQALAAVGKRDEALQHLEGALRVHPECVPALTQLGNILLSTDPPRAARAFESILRLEPDSSWAHNNLGSLLASTNPALARRHLERAVAFDPGNYQAYNNLANNLFRAGDVRGAVACYRRAIEISPGFEPARRNLALIESATQALAPSVRPQ